MTMAHAKCAVAFIPAFSREGPVGRDPGTPHPTARLAEQARAIFAAHLDIGSHRVFFFGSRVQGTNSERSDIDIGVEGPREVPASAIIAIREELDNLPTLYTFDVVDFRKVSPGFREEALKEVEYVN